MSLLDTGQVDDLAWRVERLDADMQEVLRELQVLRAMVLRLTEGPSS